FVVTPFGFTFSFPASVQSTHSFSVTVTALNGDGTTTATNFDGAADELTLTANGPGTMTPASPAQNPVSGVATFNNLSLDNIGSYTFPLTGTGSGDSGVTATSPSSILVTANHLVFSSVPSTVVSGAQFSVTVLAEDVNGHKDPTFTGQVTLGKFSGPGTL